MRWPGPCLARPDAPDADSRTMLTIGSGLIMMAIAAAAALACVITVVGAVQLTANRRHGYFHLVIPAILITGAMTIALSGRSIDFNAAQLLTEHTIKHPLAIWVQRIGSIVILTASAERIISHFSQQKNLLGTAPMLLLCFIAFWAGSIASPMFFSAHPLFRHDAFYTLVIGTAALLLTPEEGKQTLLRARDGLFLFQAAGYLMLIVNAGIVLDSNYTQGLIPGVPRFAGLAPHAVTMGMLAQLSLLCLWASPYADPRLNRAAWALGLATLFLAQSKTAWVSFSFCATAMFLCQHGASFRKNLTDPERPQLAITFITGTLLLLGVVFVYAIFGGLGSRLDHFLNSDSGMQLTSLTGRDLIWAAAYEEWLRNPIFGYGPTFLNLPYRLGIGLPSAIHGHNQYMDVLPRAGLAGAIPLTFYLIALLTLAVRHAAVSRGLTLALFLALGLRAVSEVPLTLSGYGSEFIGHLLLLVLLPAYNAYTQHTVSAKTPTADLPLQRARVTT